MGRGTADHDGDLAPVLEGDRARLARVAVAVDVDGNPRCRSAEAAHASAGQPDVPLREELAEAVELVLPRLGVEHTVVEVRVQRRGAGLCARRADSAVRE